MAMRKTGRRVRNTFFFLLWLIFFVGYLGRAHFVMVMPLIRADLGLNCTTAGMAMSAIFLGYLLFQFTGTSISLRLGPRKALTLALVWWGLFTALTGVVPALAAMLVVRCLLGVGETLHPASAWICLLNWFPRTEWNRANAVILTSAAFAGVATPLMVTGLLKIAGWQASFFFPAFLCALLAVLTWSTLRDRPEEHPSVSAGELAEIRQGRPDAAPGPDAASPGLFRLLARPGILLILAVYFLQSLALWGFVCWAPSYLATARGLDMTTMGLKLPIVFGAALPGMVLAGPLLEKVFRRRLRLFLSAIWTAGALSFYHAQATADITLCVLYLALGAMFGVSMFVGVFWNLPRTVLPRPVFNKATNLLMTASHLAGCIAPVALGWLIDNSLNGFDSALIAIEAALLLAAALVLLIPYRAMPAEEAGGGSAARRNGGSA